MTGIEKQEPETLSQWLRRIQLDWQLDSAQMAQLAHVPVAIYEGWVRAGGAGGEGTRGSAENAPGVPVATVPAGMENAVPLIAVYKRLRAVLPDPVEQVKWLTRPHSAFDQNTPFDVARSSLQNLQWLSYFLEYAPERADTLKLSED